MKLYVDAGHGGIDPGAVGHGLREKDIVLDLAKRIRRMLQQYQGVEVKLSRNTDMTKSLAARTHEANAWSADLFLSLHCNAFNGQARGYEDFTYHRLREQALAKRYQQIIHQEVSQAIGIPNRGKKQENFHVLRESTMPAILTENGFIDNPEDAHLMKQSTWREQVAAAHVTAIVKIFNLNKQQNSQVGDHFAVISGSFVDRNNAEIAKEKLIAKNIDAFVKEVEVNGKNMYRVQAGVFSKLENAKRFKEILAQARIDSFITAV